MPIIEQPITGQEINIPPRLPAILKQFCKAAIRTQPYDLLRWSSAYFRALAEGEEPPTKLRLEYPPPSTASGLTLGFLRVLLRQFGDYNKILSLDTILRRWDCLCLDRKDLNLIMMIGKFRRKCQVKKFLAIAVGLLGSSLFETMLMICELFTHEPDGGSAMVPVTLFMEIYGYLAGLRCDGGKRESSDEDLTEYILCDEGETTTVSSEFHDFSEEMKPPIDRMCSMTSQDTEADINLDLDSTSKDELDSSKVDVTPQLAESDSIRNSVSDGRFEDESSNGTLKPEQSTDISGTETESSKQVPTTDEHESSKMLGISQEEDSKITQTENSTNITDSGRGRRRRKITDTRLLKYYPNVPGIGPRLSAEEVASVAIWMSECARLQEGLIGPRNLRHIHCPPLDRLHGPDSG